MGPVLGSRVIADWLRMEHRCVWEDDHAPPAIHQDFPLQAAAAGDAHLDVPVCQELW